jgi:hypothetical protein
VLPGAFIEINAFPLSLKTSPRGPAGAATNLNFAPRWSGLPALIEEGERDTPRRGSPCSTYDGASLCFIEHDEWMVVDAAVRPEHTVLEFGARYGTTSCRLARATNSSGA